MRVQDLSIRKRLLLSNFMMIFIPVVFLLAVSISIFLALQFGNVNRAAVISFIWPESGPNMSLQFELSRLRVRADQFSGNMGRLRQASDHLEDLGLTVAILQHGKMLYATAGTEPMQTVAKAKANSPGGDTSLIWSQQEFAFQYVSNETGVQLAVTGDIPMQRDSGFIDLSSKDLLKGAFYLLVAVTILLTIGIGLYVSRWLALQILLPLDKLRRIADDISQGNLDRPVVAEQNDEIGETCRAFETMRLQLKAARDTRDQYDRNRKELIAGISHDLSTPLTKIEGYAYGLMDGIANTPEKRRRYVQMILETSETMGRLVKTLFLFSKFDLGQVQFHWENVDVCGYLADYLEEQAEPFRRRGLVIHLTDTMHHAVIAMDRMQFQRVLENIIENSIKYKEADQGSLTIAISPDDAGKVRLSFADDGRGVQAEELPKLFDSFYRTDKARTNVARGSGLGLAVVRQIVQEMKGRIWAEQTTPRGLTICMVLPLRQGGEEHEEYTHH